jgi:hypothetical protein
MIIWKIYPQDPDLNDENFEEIASVYCKLFKKEQKVILNLSNPIMRHIRKTKRHNSKCFSKESLKLCTLLHLSPLPVIVCITCINPINVKNFLNQNILNRIILIIQNASYQT